MFLERFEQFWMASGVLEKIGQKSATKILSLIQCGPITSTKQRRDGTSRKKSSEKINKTIHEK